MANKNNWTGENFTMTVRDDGSFEIEGLDGVFTMTEKLIEGDIVYTVASAGYGEWTGYRFGDDLALFADYFGGIQREDKNEYVAFAQLAWNII